MIGMDVSRYVEVERAIFQNGKIGLEILVEVLFRVFEVIDTICSIR